MESRAINILIWLTSPSGAAGYVNWDEGQPGWKNYIDYEKCIFLGNKEQFGLKWHDHRCSYDGAAPLCQYRPTDSIATPAPELEVCCMLEREEEALTWMIDDGGKWLACAYDLFDAIILTKNTTRIPFNGPTSRWIPFHEISFRFNISIWMSNSFSGRRGCWRSEWIRRLRPLILLSSYEQSKVLSTEKAKKLVFKTQK